MLGLGRASISCLLLLPASASRTGRPYDYGFDVTGTLTKRQNTSDWIIVTSLENGTENGTPARAEIRELKRDRYAWDLYLLALSMFHWSHPHAFDSWYQIAGIHGFPYVPWNGVPGVNFTMGYCQHASILFPSWHRPYLALVEQQLYSRVQEIASLFKNESERELYQSAARDWRMPYWDWALRPSDGGPVYLEDFGEEMLNIYGPNGWQLISNPLYSYHFSTEEKLDFDFELLRRWNETMRSPSDDTSNAFSRHDNVTRQIDALLTQNQQSLFMLFASYSNFAAFSNRVFRADGNDTDFASIEGLHDTMHNVLGSGGHMEFITYSAFDPIFFLHHTNVDRLIAMWQALNPSSWVGPYAAHLASFTNQAGAILDDKTGLMPFYANEDGDFWTSETARDTLAFGYVYEDTADVSLTGPSNPSALDNLKEVITEKYGQSSPSLSFNDSVDSWGGLQDGVITARVQQDSMSSGNFVPDLSDHSKIPNPPASLIMDKNDRYTEWLVNVRYTISEVDRPMSVLFFLGYVVDDPSEWRWAPNLVGNLGVSSIGSAADPGIQATGTVPLTAGLAKMVSVRMVRSLEPEDVTNYLREHLQFRVLDFNNEPVDVDVGGLGGLVIKVASASVRASRCKSEFPVWEQPVTRFTISRSCKA